MKGKLRLRMGTYNRLITLAGEKDLEEFIVLAVQEETDRPRGKIDHCERSDCEE